ncbi:hypothetical protein ACPPVU_17010 [Mucilaginibacter sp. McL0603]|uniref:hypothetical protein n=1 Tax=Mucilaginibacter sp. McL0603 TaxID=3415670 RepID=UPI003CF0974D
MKLPDNIDKITIEKPNDFSVFPPIGFIEIREGNDGAGDNYGLYWAVGKEGEEPIVCHKLHEESLLVPEFPNLDSFLEWYYIEQEQPIPFINLSDKRFFLNLYNKSRVLTKNGKTEDAIQALEESIELFAEYTDSWTLLAYNYYTQNEIEKAEYASLNSIISNYAFGLPSKKAIDQFNRIDSSGKYKNHPLVKRKDGLLSGSSYFAPFTLDYDRILEVIEEFKELRDHKSALILEQNYAYLMKSEKSEIKKKYNFNGNIWSNNFRKEILIFYPDRI